MISKAQIWREKPKFPLIAIQNYSENIAENDDKYHKPYQHNYIVAWKARI
jgi:hypothetical protein